MINNLGFSATNLPHAIITQGTAGISYAPTQKVIDIGMAVGGMGNDTINIGSGSVGPPGPPGPPGFPGLVPVTTVITTPFTVTLNDYFLGVAVAGPSSVILPTSPTGTVFIIKDIDGDAATNPITITGLGALIDGSASATITTDYGAIQCIFNGIEWSIT